MSTTIEEQTTSTAGETTDTPPPPESEDALFDKSHYDDPELALQKIDGEGVDDIVVKFSGSVTLNRTDPEDVALMRAMKGGGDVSLMIEGRCAKKAWSFSDDGDGGVKEVRLEHAVNVHTVYRPVT